MPAASSIYAERLWRPGRGRRLTHVFGRNARSQRSHADDGSSNVAGFLPFRFGGHIPLLDFLLFARGCIRRGSRDTGFHVGLSFAGLAEETHEKSCVAGLTLADKSRAHPPLTLRLQKSGHAGNIETTCNLPMAPAGSAAALK